MHECACYLCVHYHSKVWGHLDISLFSLKTCMKGVAKLIGKYSQDVDEVINYYF